MRSAHAACIQILKVEPAHADAYFLLGMIALASGNLGKALELIDRALSFAPGKPEYLAQRARCYSLLNRDDDATAVAEEALAAGLEKASELDLIGVVFSRAGQHQRAAELFARATEFGMENAGIFYNLGSSLQFVGRFDEAEAAFETAIQLEPEFYKAHFSLAGSRRQTKDNNHIERLEGLLSKAEGEADAGLYLHHALAKEYEDIGRYADAFTHLSRGKSRKKDSIAYSIDDDRDLFEAIKTTFSAERLSNPARGHASDEPIFVVGMPRSGTTLVERILSSHTQVSSAGELQQFAIAVKRATGTRSPNVLDAETMHAAAELDFAALGHDYIEDTRGVAAGRKHFVDKMPLNFLHLACIHMALPEARIICLRRDPLDTCLGNFRQLFALEFAYYRYAYDLMDIGDYFAMFSNLMDHWKRVLPGKILEVQYEDLVGAPEEQIRRMLDHCGLELEPACLEFERNVAPVATASALQVRRPLHTESVGRWRQYARQLEPLRERLLDQGIVIKI